MPTLTEARIKAITPPEKGQRIIYDDHKDAPKGFGLRTTASGTKSFILRYFVGGKERRMTIGEWGPNTWSLAAARKQAGEFKKQVDRGSDILAERRRERREPTVAEAIEDYCNAHVDKLASGRAVRSTLERYLAKELGKDKLRDVRRRDVIAVIEAVARTRARQAGLLLTYTKLLFAWAEDRELIDANPAATIKPRTVDRRLSARQRARVLDTEEVKAFWEQADTCGMHRLTALCLKFILVTGQRPGEVVGMHEREIKDRVWTIPAERRGKTNTAHVVPLTSTAIALLDQARKEVRRLSRRRKVKPSGYLFETRPGGYPAVNALDRAVRRYARQLANKEVETWGNWTPHDLRRTMRTGLSAAGVSETVAELVIGHTRKGIAAVYDLHRFDAEKRSALEAWERRLDRILAGKPADSNIVPMVGR